MTNSNTYSIQNIKVKICSIPIFPIFSGHKSMFFGSRKSFLFHKWSKFGFLSWSDVFKLQFCNMTSCWFYTNGNASLFYDPCQFFCTLSPAFKTSKTFFSLSRDNEASASKICIPLDPYDRDFINFIVYFPYNHSGCMYKISNLSFWIMEILQQCSDLWNYHRRLMFIFSQFLIIFVEVWHYKK